MSEIQLPNYAEHSVEYKMAILAEKDISEKVTKAIKSDKAHRRWFWELLQNAKDTIVDTPNRKVSIRLTYSKTDLGEPTIIFEHDGNPFKFANEPTRFDDLTNLILPLSGKTPGKTVGKFGTGFLSTHILSMKFRVEGIYENENGEYFEFNIVIDRSETDRTKLIESIVKSLIEQKHSFKRTTGSYIPGEKNFKTTKFIYYLANNKNGSEYAYNIVDEGINDIQQTLPYVLNFVNEIDTVELVDKETHKQRVVFKKEKVEQKDKINICTISKTIWDLENKKIPHDNILLATLKDESVEVACEVFPCDNFFKLIDFKTKYVKNTGKEFPILFSSFPLIGSDDFKFPLVVNSREFNPNETRDGIELKTNIDGNQLLIERAVELYLEYLEIASKNWKDVYLLAITHNSISASHDWINKKWFEEGNADFNGVIKTIREKIINTPLVDVITNEGKIERKSIKSDTGVNQIYFPLKDKKEKLYEFGTGVFPSSLPIIADADNWSTVVWNDKDFTRVNIEFLVQGIASHDNVSNLAKKIYNDSTKINDTLEWLYNFYNTIKCDYKDKTSILFNYVINNIPQGIIPDRDLKFSLLNTLKKDVGYNPTRGNDAENDGFIDETLLSILKDVTGENLKAVLLHHRFSKLLTTNEILTEENVAVRIRDIIEDKLRKSDEHSTEFKNSISALYDWISIKENDVKDYFKEAFKNRILSAIMPAEKIKYVTKILELDRNKKISLERQVELFGDPNFDRIFELGKRAFENEQLEEADFAFKKIIGIHIENLVRGKIQKDVQNFKVGVQERQGGQDIVILIDGNIVHYIEVKSRWNNSRSITMSNVQIKKATRNKTIYSLCSVDMSGYNPVDGTRYAVPDIHLIIDRIKFLNNIGEKIEPLISNAMLAETVDDEIRLTDEYRAIIPQALINKEGDDFDKFVDYLINKFELA